MTQLQNSQQIIEEQIFELQQPSSTEALLGEPLSDTLYVVDEKPSGSYRVTGMFQNVQPDMDEPQAVNQLLERPRISFFDLSWSSW